MKNLFDTVNVADIPVGLRGSLSKSSETYQQRNPRHARNVLVEEVEALIHIVTRLANMKTQTQTQRDLRFDAQTILLALEMDWTKKAD